MTSNEEEEEREQSKGHGRPNLWWAQQREREATGMGGNFRAVPTPKRGQQTVNPEDVIGQDDLCWCGQPYDHDWPGKDKGRKHPKESTVSSAAAEAPHITKRDLNGFEDILVEIIFTAVNVYGLRHRLTRTGIILYPKDGSEAYTIHRNANDRSVKAAKVWFVKHVVELDKISESGLVKDKKTAADLAADTLISRGTTAMKKEVTEDDLRRLAAEKNSPEHPVPEPEERPSDRHSKDPGPHQPQSLEELQRAVRRGSHHSLAVTYPVNPDNTWGPMYNRHTGALIEGFERFGETNTIRCTRCEWTGISRAVSGHDLVHNKVRQEKMWGARAQTKKRETKAANLTNKRVREAIEILHEAVGYESGDPNQVENLKARVAELEKENGDLQARLDLLREALRA